MCHYLAWKRILDARSLILEGMQWLVGNGYDINLSINTIHRSLILVL